MPYAIAKLNSEYYLKMYCEQYDLQIASLGYFNGFGLRQNSNKLMQYQFLFLLIKRLK